MSTDRYESDLSNGDNSLMRGMFSCIFARTDVIHRQHLAFTYVTPWGFAVFWRKASGTHIAFTQGNTWVIHGEMLGGAFAHRIFNSLHSDSAAVLHGEMLGFTQGKRCPAAFPQGET